jgi:type IV pilus assembly protein PilQ
VRTNTLIITDLADRLRRANELLTKLDQPEPQVEIEARIVQTSRDFARSIGVQWGVSGRMTPELGNTSPLAFPNQGSLSGRTGTVQGAPGDTKAVGTAVDLAVPAASSAIGLALGSVNGSFNLDVALSALERTGKGRILSRPRVSTQNNQEAEVMQARRSDPDHREQHDDGHLQGRGTSGHASITASNTVIANRHRRVAGLREQSG